MKSIVKFIFNFLRNLSLFLVIGFVGIAIYLETNEQAIDQLIVFLEKDLEKRETFSKNETVEKGNYLQIQDVEETPLNRDRIKKIKFEVKGGYAYLRTSQVMYVKSGEATELVTTTGDTIIVKSRLFEIENLLNQVIDEKFYKIKSAVINCNYIQQLIKESNKYNEKYTYQHVLIMEDGERIPISEMKAKELFEILDDLSFDSNF